MHITWDLGGPLQGMWVNARFAPTNVGKNEQLPVTVRCSAGGGLHGLSVQPIYWRPTWKTVQAHVLPSVISAERNSTAGGLCRTRSRSRLPSSRRVGMKKPTERPRIPTRRSNNDKRRLISTPDPCHIAVLLQNLKYRGSSKHKLHPHLFDLEPFRGDRGDATLCDRDADFRPEDLGTINGMIERGLRAGLVGHSDVIWTIADNGWIYEARLTNVVQTEYHGYPVLPREPIAEIVYRRFAEWAQQNGGQAACLAAENCKSRYGFR